MIDIKNLTKIFKGKKVLENITASVKEGRVVAILGPSGSGKSTLLRCMNLLEQPDTGHILIKGKDITQKDTDIRLIRQRIGMVFQHFQLFPHLTVLENITYAPRKVLNLSEAEAAIKAKELLERVGLLEKEKAYPAHLSGGQKQRVAIARALAMEPEAILFDEPTSALDPEMVKEVLEVIKKLASLGMTLLIVTHEMNFAKEIADEIWFLDQGHLLEVASPQEFFNSPKTPRAQEFLKKVL